MSSIPDFNTSIQATEGWVDDLMRRLGWRDRQRVYMALLSGLHALRDVLARDQAILLGAQLPALLRGLYYEGWHTGTRSASKSRAAFLERIHDGLHRDPGVDSDQVARCLFALLAERLPSAELEDVKAATPRELHNLWPS